MVKLQKCDCVQSKIALFGNIIDRIGVFVDAKMSTSFKIVSNPANLTELRGFLVIAGCYCHFIRLLSTVLASLHVVTFGKIKFFVDS